MISRWEWLLLQFSRRLWVRATLFSVLAVGTALGGVVLAPYVPSGLSASIGADAIDDILNILAVSMLTVTTFSLNVMVSAYSAVTNSATPRAARLLRDDPTTQNVLGTFIGSFLYSLVGIIALSAGAYGEQGRLALFVVTIGVIVLIVATLLRWIDYLNSLGRVVATIERVEDATLDAMLPRVEEPYLGARPLQDTHVPPTAEPIYADEVGYVQHIDMDALSTCAGEAGGQIFVEALPGTFVDPGRPLARLHGSGKDEVGDRIAAAFDIGQERTFDQDPRFGLCVLAEIASRALSPAVNDPGTAIDVVGRAERILLQWTPRKESGSSEEPHYPNVWVPPISTADMFDDVFTTLARDGAGLFEVQVRIQKALLTLFETGSEPVRKAAKAQSEDALARAEEALTLEIDKERVRRVAERFTLDT